MTLPMKASQGTFLGISDLPLFEHSIKKRLVTSKH